MTKHDDPLYHRASEIAAKSTVDKVRKLQFRDEDEAIEYDREYCHELYDDMREARYGRW